MLLVNAVERHGSNDWKAVASEVPNRTNKACRKRWLHSLSPEIKKSAWTASEDKTLLDLYAVYGGKWSTIARHIPGRTDDACSKRYREALDPSLKKDEWTAEEDAKLREVYSRIGGRWKEVGQELQRSSLACRNRLRLLERKQQANDAQIQNNSEDIEAVNWPPYYPPEAYPGITSLGRFREPTPSLVSVPSPDVAPFRFSSSSLSAALSDPRTYPPLPPETPPSELDTDFINGSSPSSASPSLFRNDSFDDFHDEPMLLADSLESPFSAPSISYSYDGDGTYIDGSINMSPIVSIDRHFLQDVASKSPQMFATNVPNFSNLPHQLNLYEDFSSASSSPFERVSSLSPTSSPSTASPVDLPATDQPFSLLFSPSYPIKPRSKSAPHRQTRPVGETRLSSIMPVTSDDSVRAYACGHPACWPAGESSSRACFRTSKELFDHNRNAHRDETERSYRCGLQGCQKSWKSLNGLQYHLQVSTEHFRSALSSRFSAQSSSRTNSSGTVSDPEDPQRTFACKHPECFKTYKHASGLRYHLKHGHSKQLPAQFSVVPPSLERELPARTKKMRPKPTV